MVTTTGKTITHFAYRTKEGLGLIEASPLPAKDSTSFPFLKGDYSNLIYDKSGTYLAYSTSEGVKVHCAETHKEVQSITIKDVITMEFSLKGNYLAIWKRYNKEEEINNLILYSIKEGKVVNSFIQKSIENWNLQWTYDESFMARIVTNEVHFYDTKKMEKKSPSFKLRLEGVKAFSLSCGKVPHVAIFVPERKSAPAYVRLYSIPNFNTPVASKTFFKADKVSMEWNPLGTNILILTQTEVDKTGKSYYGESNLYYLSVAGNFDCRVPLDKEGPIHDFSWSPNSKEFSICYGFMPSKTSIFDQRVNKVHSFNELSRNFVKFSPHSKYFLLAGFGNLNGNLDVYDLNGYKKIASIDASGSSYCEWLPNGKHFLTATCSPRLRVDNGFKLWHYSGALVYEKSIQVLYQVLIRDLSIDLFPIKQNTQSPPPKSILVKKAVQTGSYVPPHLRNKVSTTNNNSAPVVSKEDKQAEAEQITKKIRNLNKKIKQIEELIFNATQGVKLNPEQAKKIKNKPDLQYEVSQLEDKLKKLQV